MFYYYFITFYILLYQIEIFNYIDKLHVIYNNIFRMSVSVPIFEENIRLWFGTYYYIYRDIKKSEYYKFDNHAKILHDQHYHRTNYYLK